MGIIGALLLIFIGVPGLTALTAILNGWALSILWGWFFVPILDMPSIGIAQAIGISLVVNYLTHQRDTYKDKSKSPRDTFISADIIALQDYDRFMARIGYLLNDDKTEDLENERTDTLRGNSL